MIASPTLRLLTLAGIGSLAAVPALAQDSYFYGGGSGGQSRAHIDHDRIATTLAGSGLTATTQSDNRDTSYKVLGGYQVNRYFGMEASFFNLGNFGFHSTTTPTGTLDGHFRLQGAAFDLVGTLPMTESLSLIGRAGAAYTRTRDTFITSGAVTVANQSPSDRQVGPKLGIGLQYEISRSFFVRTEFETFRASDALGQKSNVHMLSVGFVVPFGRAPMSAPRPMAAADVAPPPMAMTPAPAPMVATAAPPPLVVVMTPDRKRVSFSAESLFGFDKSEVQPEGRAALDAFAVEMNGTTYDVITVEGNADRIGGAAYNQKLSEERAEAVKAYLVNTGGLDGSKINAVGRGESTPVTTAEDCKGERKSSKLIICLQPDRRVDVEVKGTR